MPNMTRETPRKQSRLSYGSTLFALLLVLGAMAVRAEEDQHHKEVLIESPVLMVRTGQHKPGITYTVVGGRSFLGVQTVGLTPELRLHFGVPEDAGVLVSKIVDESPAVEVGLSVGDIITTVDGQEVTSPSELAQAIGQFDSGEVVDLEIWRDGELLQLQPTLTQREGPWVDIRQFGVDMDHLQSMEWKDSDFERVIQIETQTLNQAIERLNQEMDSPEWHERIHSFRQHQGSLMNRIEELEERLKELEKELQQLPEGD